MKLKIIFFVVVAMSFCTCGTTKTPIVNTVNTEAAQSDKNYKLLYSLPRTAINIKIKVHKRAYKKGPYQQYAKSYLNVSDAIVEDRESWNIYDVKLSSYSIPDTSKTYFFETKREEDVVYFSLSKSGFLKSVFPVDAVAENVSQKRLNRKYHKNSKETKSPYNVSYKDINFDNVPLPKSVVGKTTLSEQAAELSKKILSIREDRAAILVGDGYTENMPDGKALEVMLKQIDFIHSQYLSMFVGKQVDEEFEYNFTYIPENNRKYSKVILFRFSEEQGIVGDADMSGAPITLELKSYNKLSAYKKFKYSSMFVKKSSKKADIGLHYNVPETALVRLIKDNEKLAENRIVICQMGVVDKLPSEYLDGYYTIDFYPNTGALKSIKKNSNFQK